MLQIYRNKEQNTKKRSQDNFYKILLQEDGPEMNPCEEELLVKNDIREQVDVAALKVKNMQLEREPQDLWHSGK